jgi:hypothetical protein
MKLFQFCWAFLLSPASGAFAKFFNRNGGWKKVGFPKTPKGKNNFKIYPFSVCKAFVNRLPGVPGARAGLHGLYTARRFPAAALPAKKRGRSLLICTQNSGHIKN